MRITVLQRGSSPNMISFYPIEIECRGTGIKEDPAIIEPSEVIRESIYLRDYSIYIHIKNLDKRYISLVNCQNITLSNCQLKYLDIFNSSNIQIDSLLVAKLLRFYSNRDVIIKDSNFGKAKLNKSNSNTFINCSFKKLKKTLSPDNVFESSTIAGKKVSDVEERRTIDFITKWHIKQLTFVVVAYVGFFIIFPLLFESVFGDSILVPMLIWGVFLCTIIFIFPLILRKIKQRKEVKNEKI